MRARRRTQEREKASLAELLRPIYGGDKNSERVAPQSIGGAGRLNHHGDDRRPARRLEKAAVLIAALGPGDTKAVLGGPDHARHLDRDLSFADLREGIRSEERRVGKECVSTCRSRGAPYT